METNLTLGDYVQAIKGATPKLLDHILQHAQRNSKIGFSEYVILEGLADAERSRHA